VKDHQEISDPAVVKALSHPLRIQILGVLEKRTASPNELAREFDAALGTVAYHVRELARYGFIELVKKTPRRGAVEHYYRAKARPRVSDAGWAATPSVVKQAMVRSALEQISTFVNAAALEGGFDREQAHLNRVELVVDERGWEELSKELWRVLQALPKIEEASRKRLGRSDHDGEQRVTVVTMAFETAEPMIARAAAAAPRRPAKRLARTGAGR
jgi:DNA-binding transcriptional ArsR family regulator